ncbi:phosphatidate cytidylyltransferase [Haoranjiania flava]|uniref:Phosphatidate cytidylyltransferase n=1 Tax=Haoranjiania flava TaxID=1856322 RepID=A0AAE3LR66_9BACT|nr:phosphatidate cytidylyltransferase [Haoranjiania flava]MCU7695145.1 phosphatidate cytidylyltransferase [Haoranjiania flava]
MAINPGALKTRALSSAVFVALMLAAVLWSQWSFYLLFLVIHCGCWIELQRLFGRTTPEYMYVKTELRSMPVIFGFGFMLYCIQPESNFYNQNYFLKGFAFGLMITAFVVWLFRFLQLKSYKKIVSRYTLLGFLYLSLTFGLLFHLRSSFPADNRYFEIDFGLRIVLALMFSIWINDTMQYIVGSLIGKTPFSKISPKKTWEGTVGGILMCVVVISVTGYFTGFLPLTLLMPIAAIAGIFGTMGDLLESRLKRNAGVKDSGNILPGHGGFLDRFDSFIFSIPFVWMAVFLWLKLHH